MAATVGDAIMKILLVDESWTIRNMQKNTLRTLGYEDIDEAADGLEALSALSREKPDLMLVDWHMPNMDGITLIRKVRETDKALPIIMVTTEAEKSRVMEAVKAGVNNYVVKPFTAETFAAKIRQTLGKVAVSA
jgi:two-component system chemotaxis response regulator CheY